MSFLLPILEGAAPSLIGGLINGGSNAALSGLEGQSNMFQTGLMAQEMLGQEQLDAQSTAFDEAMNQMSENMREVNTLRDVQMAQRKADDGITKKFIQAISQ